MSATWHDWIREARDTLSKKLWPVRNETPIPFYALSDAVVGHIMRRLERELLTDTTLYCDMQEEARRRKIVWKETHRILKMYPYEEGLHFIGTSTCVNPFGIEINTVASEPGSSRTGKLFLTWEEIDQLREEVTRALGCSNPSAPNPGNERFLDL